MEIWKDIKGYEGMYQVSDLGRVRSLDRKCLNREGVMVRRKGAIKSLSKNRQGYLYVNLSSGTKNATNKRTRVHRLVAEAFIPNPENKPQVNHKDLDKSNNSVSNLEWVTRKENVEHAWENGACKSRSGCHLSKTHKQNLSKARREKAKAVLMIDDNGSVINVFDCVSDAEEKVFNGKRTHISCCCRGERKTCGGYRWEYA